MSKLQKEMKVISRNNIERQKLSSIIGTLNMRQVKKHERSTHDIITVNDDLTKFRQSSGRSKSGVVCSQKEASDLRRHSHILKARWQVPLRSLDQTEPIHAVSRKIQQLPTLMPTQSKTSQEDKPATVESKIVARQLTVGSAGHPLATRPIIVRSQSVPGYTHSHISKVTYLNDDDHKSLLAESDDSGLHSGNIQRMDEFERKSVRRTQIILNPDGTRADCKDSIRYIRPQERHKYDIATSRRLGFLKRSIPADSTAGIGKNLLNGAFSTNSRKSALCMLVEMNNRKIERSLKVKPNVTLQKKLEDFLKSLEKA